MKHALLVLVAACSSSSTQPPAPRPAAAPAAAPAAPVAKGTVTRRTFHSAALGVDKTYVVYLPAGYDTSTSTRYPVFYYLNGLTGSERDWTHAGHIDAAADALGLQAIIVMPDGDDGFYTDSTMPIDYETCMKDGTGLFMPVMQHHPTQCVRQRNYETYIVKDVVGDVDATYRTIASRDARAIAGLSMGGFGALSLSMRHPDEFAAAASHSGVDALLYAGPHPYGTGIVTLVTDLKNWGRTGDPQVNRIGEWMVGTFGTDLANWKAHDPASLAQKLEPGKLALYIDCGTEDDFGLDAQASYLHDLLDQRHIEHEFFLGPGHHNFEFWAQRVSKSLAFLRTHTAKPQ